MKIYTKTGDDGTTALFSGGRVAKTHPRVEAYGTVDELNSVLGMVRALKPSQQADSWLEHVQNQLFYLGADLATPHDAKSAHVVRMDEAAIQWLEATIDTMSAQIPPLTRFILPGGTPSAAQLHIARTICRRAERCAVSLQGDEPIGDLPVHYLNRLSDWLFTLARWENHQQGIKEDEWSVR
jgi:cob(I)alamin adenosyltransferase